MPIVTLLDTEKLQFHTSNLSERDLAQVEPGKPAEITFKAYPSQPVQGEVARIAPQAEGSVGDAAVFTVMIDLTETADLSPQPWHDRPRRNQQPIIGDRNLKRYFLDLLSVIIITNIINKGARPALFLMLVE